MTTTMAQFIIANDRVIVQGIHGEYKYKIH